MLRFIFVYLCNYVSSRTTVSQAKKGGGSKDLTMAAEQTSHLQTLGKPTEMNRRLCLYVCMYVCSLGIPATDSDQKYQWNYVPTATVRSYQTLPMCMCVCICKHVCMYVRIDLCFILITVCLC